MKSRRGGRFLRSPATLVCVAAFMLLTISALAQQQLQTLTNHVPLAVSNGQAALVGPMPPTQPLHLAIFLPLRNEPALDTLLNQLYDPTSSNFRHFLSVSQFTDQFGPTTDDYQSVVNFAEANGFAVEPAPPNRLFVDIDGTVAQVENAFHVSMNMYRHPTENRVFFSPDREPSLNLSVQVTYIGGLNDYSMPKPALATGSPVAQATGSGPGTFFIPSDMRAAYYGTGSLTGSGQCVGLGEFGGYLISDVTSTLAPSGGPNTATSTQSGSTYTVTYTTGGVQYTIPVNNPSFSGYQPVSDTGDVGEQALDIAQAIGMAPGLSQVRVYTVPYSFVQSGNYTYPAGSPAYDWDMFNKMATDTNSCSQLSLSWHWEPANASNPNSPDETIFKEFRSQGQSFFAASGDWGAFPTPLDYYYPAESTNVIAVGGTDLTTNGAGGSWNSEIAWGGVNQACIRPYASSGGISPHDVPIPSYQQLSGVINGLNQGSALYRNIPDVAAQADCVNYYCDQGVCSNNTGGYPQGGTSYAGPRWAGFMALVNQEAMADTGATVGFLNNYVYPIGVGPNYTTDFHDIASGTNYCYDVNGVVNSDCGQTVYFNAVTGYDLVTGWGSPNGQNLINALIAALPLQTAAPTNTGSYTVWGGPPDPTITFTITLYDTTPNAEIYFTVPGCAGNLNGSSPVTSGGSFTLVYNPQYNCNPSGTMYATATGYTQSGTLPIGFP